MQNEEFDYPGRTACEWMKHITTLLLCWFPCIFTYFGFSFSDSVIVNDEFTKKLLDIYLTVKKEGIKQVYDIRLVIQSALCTPGSFISCTLYACY